MTLATTLSAAPGKPSKVQVIAVNGGYQLRVDGQPFFVKGAGGDYSKQALKDAGGNAFRTWGSDRIEGRLDEAQRLGLKVAVGIWLEHERHGFSYDDPAKVEQQFEKAKAAILKYKDHPAVLLWGIGNEMDGYAAGDNPRIWGLVQQIAAFAKQVDPNHPTMTVVAEVGGKRIACIHELCPDVDIVGLNSYGGAPSIGQRYRAAGGTKPYIVTEFGPPGTWEIQKTPWGAPPELTSTQKADAYRNAYERGILAEKDKLCLGSFVFTWGNKQEATGTWYGLFLPDGSRTAAVDVMQELWTGKPPANRVPTITPIQIESATLAPGATFEAKIETSDPENDPLQAEWKLLHETEVYGTGGDAEPVPPTVEGAITRSDPSGATVKTPEKPGRYRLFVTVRDNHGGAATANVPLLVEAVTDPARPPLAPQAALPLVLYGEGAKGAPYVWSGWMGKTDAIAIDENCRDNPKAGNTCMKCEFRSPDHFGAVAWQHPANDWGDQPAGYGLSGAKRLSFWARGAAGGEKIEVKLGIIEKNKPYHDTASALLPITLTKDWTHYEILLAGKDLRRIKTGFVWVVPGQGRPVTFYLDNIRYE